jgi:D-cysteine desulfhydrase
MIRPLFECYKGLEKKLPIIELADLPTPIEKFNTELINTSGFKNLWIKRDDLTNTVYGGNKVRKLEFILADAKKKNKNIITTFGATGTNHGVATAIFSSNLGLKSKIYLFDQPISNTVKNNLKLMVKNNAQLIHKGSLLNTALGYYVSQLFSCKQYHLPPGGSNVMGCLSFVNAAFELKQQIEQGQIPEPDHIICPVGSSGTLAGLALGCQLAGLKSKVSGIRVAPSHLGIIPICTTETVMSLMNKTYAHLRSLDKSIPMIRLNKIHLDDDYYGDGYGFSTKEGNQAIQKFDKRGINLESTYTAKAAAAAIKLCSEKPQESVLYWHTFNSAELDNNLSNKQLSSLQNSLRKIINL